MAHLNGPAVSAVILGFGLFLMTEAVTAYAAADLQDCSVLPDGGFKSACKKNKAALVFVGLFDMVGFFVCCLGAMTHFSGQSTKGFSCMVMGFGFYLFAAMTQAYATADATGCGEGGQSNACGAMVISGLVVMVGGVVALGGGAMGFLNDDDNLPLVGVAAGFGAFLLADAIMQWYSADAFACAEGSPSNICGPPVTIGLFAFFGSIACFAGAAMQMGHSSSSSSGGQQPRNDQMSNSQPGREAKPEYGNQA